ncbi:MAG: carbohydrate ABC transporter permease [Bacteroidales bacterium]|nr:carbohydrate ABC transporter permease [Bacteroidales bacterium]
MKKGNNGSKSKLNSNSDILFNIINYTFLFFCFLVVVFPLLNVVSQSLSSPKAVAAGRVWFWPVEPTLVAYQKILGSRQLLMGFYNSFIYTFFGTMINVVLSVMAAYPLSRKDFYGRQFIISIFVFTMMFSGGMIPTYLLIKNLGFIDTRWAMIIPNALTVWNVMLARTFFQNTIPVELYEASELDGASDMDIITKVVIPLSAPILAVLTLFYAVGHWNSYFSGLLYLKSQNLMPLQVVLRNLMSSVDLIQNMLGPISKEQAEMLSLIEVMKYAIIVFASIPVIMLYPVVQKHFVKGVMIGSIKG